MPYYQYSMDMEIKLANSSLELNRIEKAEEKKFSEILSKDENAIITLLDLFYPPRFWKKERTAFYPTLPIKFRKKALEFLQQEMMGGNIPSKFNQNELQKEFEKLLNKESIDVNTNIGAIRLWSYAVVEYDPQGCAILDDSSLLALSINTKAFCELLIERDILPLELLHLDVVYQIYKKWNQRRLEKLKVDLLKDEGWPLIDAVSVLSGFYALPRSVADYAIIIGFESNLSLINSPLRWVQEAQDNIYEYPRRAKGWIDRGELPIELIEIRSKWNETLKKVQSAMSLGRINHNGGTCVNRPRIKVDEDSFKSWAKERAYPLKYGHDINKGLPPKKNLITQRQSRSNSLHDLILEIVRNLTNEMGVLPNNETVWSSIYKEKPEFIESIDRWSCFAPKIVWRSDNGNVSTMSKKSFQTFISSSKFTKVNVK